MGATMAKSKPIDHVPPGLKLEGGMNADAPDEELQVALQMGREYVQVYGPGRGSPALGQSPPGTFLPTYEYLAPVQERFQRAGLSIYNWGNWRSDSVILGRPDRDQVIAGYIAMLQ